MKSFFVFRTVRGSKDEILIMRVGVKIQTSKVFSFILSKKMFSLQLKKWKGIHQGERFSSSFKTDDLSNQNIC